MGTKSKKKAQMSLSNMGEQMSAMMSVPVPVDTPQNLDSTPSNLEHQNGASGGDLPPHVAETPVEEPVVAPSADTPEQSAESAKCNGVIETESPSGSEGRSEMDPPSPVQVTIDPTQGDALYSSILGVQNTLDNFKLDVKEDSLREVVEDAISSSTITFYEDLEKKKLEHQEQLRKEGKIVTADEYYAKVKEDNTNTLEKFNQNSRSIKGQYHVIANCLSELLGRKNLVPLKPPKFKDENGKWLLQSLYLYPWYCCLRFYFSTHVRWFFKTIAWSIWCITITLGFLLARDNEALHHQQDINRYVRAYFSDNPEVSMELEGIDLMFGEVEVNPMPVNKYREYMKERKNEAKKRKR